MTLFKAGAQFYASPNQNLGGGVVHRPLSAPSPLLTDLVSYWTMDEASGQRNDSHSTNHLTDNNTVGSQAGIISNGTDFVKGDSDFLSHVDNAELDVNGDVDFTIAFWFRLEAQFTTDALVSKYTGGGTNNDQWLIYYASLIRFIIRATDNTAVNLASSLGSLSINTWRYLVCWRDGVTANIQINDGTIDQAAWTKDTKDDAVDFRVGRFGAASYSNSGVDELGLWKRVLTSGERTQLYNGGAGLAYPFS